MVARAPWRWMILAILAFGAPLAAIAFVQYRWLLELRNRSETIATQRNREAAQRAQSILEAELTSARFQVLPAVGHADLVGLHLEPIGQVFENGHRNFPYVDRFFVWAAPMASGDALFYVPEEGGFRADPERLRRLPPEVWGLRGGTARWAEFRCRPDSPPCQVVIHRILDDEDSSLLAMAGFLVDIQSFSQNFLAGFVANRLSPAVADVLGVEDVSVCIFDESDEMIFGTKSLLQQEAASSAGFHLAFGLLTESAIREPHRQLWRVAVGDPSDTRIRELVRRGALTNLAIVGAGIFTLALGCALVARSSARAAKLSDLKTRFISGISHELKTPLSMIRLYSELLELGRVPPNVERKIFYRSLRQQAEIMGDMLEDILDFSRLEAEQRATRATRLCPPQEILEEAIEMLESKTDTRPVDVSLESDLPNIRGNRSALVRVFYNLLDNAAKYSDSREPITLNAGRRNGMVAIEIADRGIGIPPEDLPHVFERFYRGQASSLVPGTGLGLSIVQAVVTSHGGRVEVESAPKRGSRFTVLLPIAHGEGT